MVRFRAFVVAVLLVGVAFAPKPVDASTAQVVHSSDGTFATGLADSLRFPDGTVRTFGALFVIPGGTVTGSSSAATADMTKPWADLTMYVSGGQAGGGGGLGRTAACHSFRNPLSWSPLADGPTVALPTGPARTVGGIQFTVTCADDAVYESYTVRWDPARLMNGTATLYEHPRPSPATDTWSPEPPLAATGAVEALARSTQEATMRVCAVRRGDGGRECFESYEGNGRIFASVSNLSTQLYWL